MEVDYALAIYNATVYRARAKPQLESPVRLLRDGQAIFTGKQLPVKLGSPNDWRQVFAAAKIKLGTDMAPGEYVLQVIITDRLAKEKYSSMSQWIDFEIVK